MKNKTDWNFHRWWITAIVGLIVILAITMVAVKDANAVNIPPFKSVADSIINTNINDTIRVWRLPSGMYGAITFNGADSNFYQGYKSGDTIIWSEFGSGSGSGSDTSIYGYTIDTSGITDEAYIRWDGVNSKWELVTAAGITETDPELDDDNVVTIGDNSTANPYINFDGPSANGYLMFEDGNNRFALKEGLYVRDSTADATGAYISLHKSRSGGSASDEDMAGAVYFRYVDASGSAEQTSGSVTSYVKDPTLGAEEGNIILSVDSAGTLTQKVAVNSSGLTIIGGIDVDSIYINSDWIKAFDGDGLSVGADGVLDVTETDPTLTDDNTVTIGDGSDGTVVLLMDAGTNGDGTLSFDDSDSTLNFYNIRTFLYWGGHLVGIDSLEADSINTKRILSDSANFNNMYADTINADSIKTADLAVTNNVAISGDLTVTDDIFCDSLDADKVFGDTVKATRFVIGTDTVTDITGSNLTISGGSLNASGGSLTYFAESEDTDTSIFSPVTNPVIRLDVADLRIGDGSTADPVVTFDGATDDGSMTFDESEAEFLFDSKLYSQYSLITDKHLYIDRDEDDAIDYVYFGPDADHSLAYTAANTRFNLTDSLIVDKKVTSDTLEATVGVIFPDSCIDEDEIDHSNVEGNWLNNVYFRLSDFVSTDIDTNGSGQLKLAQNGASTGQVQKWNGSAWVPGTDNSGSPIWTQPSNDTTYLYADDDTSIIISDDDAGAVTLAAGDDQTLTVKANTIEGSGTRVSFGDDTLRVGDDTDDDNVLIWLVASNDSVGLRFNYSDGDLEYTNDGTTWTNVGSGGGASWNWADSAGEPPFWVDSATYATLAAFADSAGAIDTTNTHIRAALNAHDDLYDNFSELSGDVDTTQANDTQWEEYIEDNAGAMFSGNTETRIAVTYNEDGTVDFVVDDMNDDQPDDDSEVPNAITVNSTDSITTTKVVRAQLGFVTPTDSIIDFLGEGLQNTAGVLSTTLGTAISSTEITDGAIVEADIADTLVDMRGDSLYIYKNSWVVMDSVLARSEVRVTEGIITINDTGGGTGPFINLVQAHKADAVLDNPEGIDIGDEAGVITFNYVPDDSALTAIQQLASVYATITDTNAGSADGSLHFTTTRNDTISTVMSIDKDGRLLLTSGLVQTGDNDTIQHFTGVGLITEDEYLKVDTSVIATRAMVRDSASAGSHPISNQAFDSTTATDNWNGDADSTTSRDILYGIFVDWDPNLNGDVDGGEISGALSSVAVSAGGTGRSTITSGEVMMGNGTGDILTVRHLALASMFRSDSTVADSAFMTKYYIDSMIDTTLADSLAFYLPLSGGTMSGTVHLGAATADSAAMTKRYIDSSAQNATVTGASNLRLGGDLELHGNILQDNHFMRLDTNIVWCVNADSALDIDTGFVYGDSLSATTRNQWIHPSVIGTPQYFGPEVDEMVIGWNSSRAMDTIYVVGGSPKWMYWMGSSGYYNSSPYYENPIIRASNDRLSWVHPYAIGTDSTDSNNRDTVWSRDPLFDSLDYETAEGNGVAHFADPELMWSENGLDMWGFFLAVVDPADMGINDSIRSSVIGIKSSNGITWRDGTDLSTSDTVTLLESMRPTIAQVGGPYSGFQPWDLLSPTICKDTNSSYEMYFVDKIDSATYGNDTTGHGTIVLRLESPQLDTLWAQRLTDSTVNLVGATKLDTCVFDAGILPDSGVIWHITVRQPPWGGPYRYMFANVNLTSPGGGGYGEVTGGYWFVSEDRGVHWSYGHEILPAPTDSSWDMKIYRGSFIFEENGSGWECPLWYSGFDTTNGASEVVGTGYTVIQFDSTFMTKADSSTIADNSVSVDDIAWPYKWYTGYDIMQRDTASSDSVYILPSGIMQPNGAGYMVKAYSGDIATNLTDTIQIVFRIDEDCGCDSIRFPFEDYGPSYITATELIGPSRDTFPNIFDSVYFSDGTNVEDYPWGMQTIYLDSAHTVNSGELFGVRFILYFAGDDDTLKIGYPQIGCQR